MKKVKKVIKKSHSRVKRTKSQPRISATIYGIEHEFIIIAGGGFLVIVFAIMLFFR